MTSVWSDPLILSPSLICLDLCNLERDVHEIEKTGISMLHVDILDGHFSPSMPLGLDTVRRVRQITNLPFDCHVMATSNDFFINELLDIGVEQIVFHVETEPHIAGTLSRIRQAGVRAGVALKPATDLGVLEYCIEQCDTVLLMLINPGYAFLKGESQVPYAAQKVRDLHNLIESRGLSTAVELDGRVSKDNIRAFGGGLANIFVVGTTCINRSELASSTKALLDLRSQILGQGASGADEPGDRAGSDGFAQFGDFEAFARAVGVDSGARVLIGRLKRFLEQMDPEEWGRD